MSTKTTNRRRQTVKENPADALARIESGFSANDAAVVMAFAAAGLDPADIDPRHNVLTFNAWKAKGRQVARGATSVRVTVWIPANGNTDGETTAPPLADGQPAENGGRRSRMRPTTARLFHVSQTIAIGSPQGTRPAAWQNPALVKPGTYESEPTAEPVANDEPAYVIAAAEIIAASSETNGPTGQRPAVNLFDWPTGDDAPQLLPLVQFAQ